MSSLALIFDLVAKDGASPVFLRGAAAADKMAAATARATAGAVTAASRMDAVAASTARFGATMTKHFTVPILAIAGVSAKMASDFNAAMTRIQTQAGASAKDVRSLTGSVLDLAKYAQQGPTELADALYHLKSVGMDNVAAMKALRTASDLAAVGHANLEDTTNALAGAWRTGIKGAQNFTEAAKTVNAVIGAGNMKMEDLNAALGTGILPTAKTFGLTLKDVGAALALFTDEGVPADAAATRLRMSMSLLGAPSKIAEKHLRDIGLTGLRLANDMRKPNGIIVAIGDLKKHLDASGLSASEQAQLLSHAFGGGRSSSAILSMVNNYDVLRKKQDQVTASMQKYSAAIAAQRKTPAAQFKLLESSLQRAAILIGNQVLPYLVKLAKWVGNVVESFNGLSSGTKRFIVIAAGVTAAVGPVLAILSRLYLLLYKIPKAIILWGVQFVKSAFLVVQGARAAELSVESMSTKSYAAGLKMRGAFTSVGSAVKALAPTLALAGGVAIIFGIVNEWQKAQAAEEAYANAVKGDIASLKPLLNQHTGAITLAAEAWTRQQLVEAGSYTAGQKLGLSLKLMTDAALGNVPALDKVRAAYKAAFNDPNTAGQLASTVGKVIELGEGAQQSQGQIRELNKVNRSLAVGFNGSANAAEHYASAQSKVKIALHNSTTATHAFRDALAGVMGLLNRASNAIAFQQSLNDLAQTFRDNKGAILGHSNAALADKAAFVDLGKQIVTQAQAMRKHGASVKTVTGYLRTHVGALREAARAGGADAGVVRRLSRMLGLIPKRIHTYIDVETQTAIQRVQALADAYKTLGQDAMSAATVTSMALKSSGASMSAHTTTSGGRGGIGDLLGTNGPTNPNASDSAAAARFPTTVPSNSAASKAASKAKEKAKKAEAARKAALAKARQQAAAARSAAQSTASGLISGIGQTASPPFQVSDLGINRIEQQINAARAKIAALGHLRPADRARFAAQIAALTALAQKQLDKLRLHIRTHDLAAFRKSLTGTAAEVRASFTAMLDDLRKAGASGGVLDRLRAREARLTAAVRRRNRDQARLDQLTTSAKDLRNSVKSAVTGAFDVTQAGTNPRSGRVTGGSLLAQQTQELNRIKRLNTDLKKLAKRGLNPTYLRELWGAGPSSLAQVEALLSMGEGAFTRFNRQERQIERAGARAGRAAANELYGGRISNARADVRAERARTHELAHAIAVAIRDELRGVSIKLNDREVNAGHHDQERRNRRHGGRS